MATTELTAARHADAPDIPAVFAHGGYVSLVGRFASMPRAEVGDVVRAHGGHVNNGGVGLGTVLVVIGQKDWTLTREGRMPDALRKLRVMSSREGFRPPVISEEQFLAAIGLAEHAGAVHQHYTTGTLAELLGVAREGVQGWVRAGLIEPARTVHGVWYFDFRQASAAKTLCELARSGVSLKRLRRSLERLRSWLPEADVPLQQLAVMERDGDILVRLAQGGLAAPDGQLQLDFDHAAAEGEAGDRDEAPRMRIGAAPGGPSVAPRSAADWVGLAVEQHEAGFLAEAVASYREALLAGGPDAQTCVDLAGALSGLGLQAEAIERCRHATEVDPGFADAWVNLGTFLAAAGRRDEACAAYRRALAIAPDDAVTHYNLADVLDEMGLNHEAAPHWKAVLHRDTASPWAAHARKRLAAV